jgi:hypothetical protein
MVAATLWITFLIAKIRLVCAPFNLFLFFVKDQLITFVSANALNEMILPL